MSISKHNATFAIDVVLGVRNFLAQLKTLPICVLNRDGASLVAASPNHQVRFIYIWPLLVCISGLNELDSLLLPSHDPEV